MSGIWDSSSINTLFGNTSGLAGMLGDYASLRNGSYGKLLKSYYGGASSVSSASSKSTTNKLDQLLEERKNPTVSADVSKANATLSSAVSNMKSSVASLQDDSLYEDTAGGSTAKDKVASALKSYVSSYNDAVASSKKSSQNAISSNLAAVMKSSSENAEALKEIGISIKSDGTLSLDEKKLASTDVSKVADLFSKDNTLGYGGTVASRISRASYYVGSASTVSADASTASTTSASGDLKSSIEKLVSDKLYAATKDADGKDTYDISGISSAAKDFIKNYNDTIASAKTSTNSGVASNLSSLLSKTSSNSTALSAIGISVGYDGKLSLDEDKFAKSDVDTMKSVLQKYGSSISSNASLVNYYAATGSNTASSYTAGGAYSSADSLVSGLYNSVG